MTLIPKFRNRHFLILDIFLLLFTPVIALTLRVDLPWGRAYAPSLATFTLLSLLIKLPVFHYFRLYQRYWAYASIDALVSIASGVIVATVLVTGVLFTLQGGGILGWVSLPRSIPFIDSLLTLLLIGGTRFSIRAAGYYQSRFDKDEQRVRVLIAGAGDAGQIVAREIYASRHVNLALVGFVDDNPEKVGATIHGVRVLGSLDKIPELVEEYRVQEVIITMPTAPGSVIREVVRACEAARVNSKILPGVYELLSGEVSFSRLREVEIGDLLRRDSVQVDSTQVEHLLAGKRVLVTGAGGSIGSELCAQIAHCQPAQLIALGHGENSLFSLAARLEKIGFESPKTAYLVADIRDHLRLENIFARYRPEIAFHAAAHKHVPLMEANIEDAITNNILGTWNVVRLAKKYAVERFVLISTDKAVNPVNVMGMTKRVAEYMVRWAAAETGRPFVAVRFGNVLGSRGSVIPLFKRQIAEGGPITITDPEMKRYFMTIPEAVQLVLQASALGHNGELFVLDMGEPVKIDDLARDMIEFSGYQVGRDIAIEYTGLRPGERLFEELFADNEHPVRTTHEKIFVNTTPPIPSPERFTQAIETLIALSHQAEPKQLREKLRQLAFLEF